MNLKGKIRLEELSVYYNMLVSVGYLVPDDIRDCKVLANDDTTPAYGVVSMSGG